MGGQGNSFLAVWYHGNIKFLVASKCLFISKHTTTGLAKLTVLLEFKVIFMHTILLCRGSLYLQISCFVWCLLCSIASHQCRDISYHATIDPPWYLVIRKKTLWYSWHMLVALVKANRQSWITRFTWVLVWNIQTDFDAYTLVL